MKRPSGAVFLCSFSQISGFGITTIMSDKDPLAQAVQDFILDVCEVMYRRGYDSAPIGAIMRLVGVPESSARQHDNEHFVLDENFEKMMLERQTPVPKRAPQGVTLH